MTSTKEQQQGTKTPPSSPRKIANPQQGMADPTTSSSTANAVVSSDGVSTATAPTVSNTACTSPLTITSLEQATANGTAAANKANNNTINNNNANPAPTSGGVPTVVNQHNNMLAVPSVETMLSSGVSKLQLGDNNQIPSMPVPQAQQLLPMMPVVLPSPSSSNNNDNSLDRASTAINRNANAAERRTSLSLSTSPMLQKRTPPTEHDNRKLFVGGIPTDVSDEEFLHFFEQFGPIIDSIVMLDRVTKRSRGFGFVTFAHEEDANKLLTAVPGKSGYIMIRNKQVELKASTPKVDDGRDTYKNHPHAHRGGGGGGQGVWRSNPPTSPQQNDHYFVRRGSRVQYNNHHQPHVAQYSGDVDGRNFDNVSVQYTQDGQQMIRPIYQQPQNYMYGPAGGGYYYTPTANASVPSSYDASYPASSMGGQAVYDGQSYPTPNNTGYYDAYQYQSEYGNQQGMPQPHYDENGNAYYAAEASAAGDIDGGFDQSYNQSYAPEEGEYEQQAAVETTTEKYE